MNYIIIAYAVAVRSYKKSKIKQPIDFICNIIEHLQLLDKLEFRWSKHWKSPTGLEDRKIHFNSVQPLEVAFHSGDDNAHESQFHLIDFKLV